MKKLLLSASALVLAATSFAQTNSSLSGNDLTTSKNGYLYSFIAPGSPNDENIANCTNDAGVMNAVNTNLAGTAFNINAAGGLEITIPAQTVASPNSARQVAVRMTTDNCSILQGTNVANLSANKTVKAKIKSTVATDAIILASSLGSAGWTTHDGGTLPIKAITTSFSEVEFSIADQSWNSQGDLTKVIGWELFLPPGTYSAMTITIEAMAFGDAVLPNSTQTIEEANGAIYPNPATDVVNVNVGSATNATVQLTDVTGKVVVSVSGVSGTTAINTSAVPAGLYVVSVSSASGVATSKVIVK